MSVLPDRGIMEMKQVIGEFEQRLGSARIRVRALPVVVALTVVCLLGAACGTSTPSSLPAPAGLPAFYSIPQPLPSGPPGTLIKSQKVTAADGLNGTVYRVMYMS